MWEQQLVAIIEAKYVDCEILLDFAVTYTAETEDTSFIEGGCIDLMLWLGSCTPAFYVKSESCSRYEATGGSFSAGSFDEGEFSVSNSRMMTINGSISSGRPLLDKVWRIVF